MKKEIKHELFWLSGIFLFPLFLLSIVLGFNKLTSLTPLNFELHDTYVVVSIYAVFPLFLLLTFCVYSIRVSLTKFKQVPQNIILIVTTTLLILLISVWVNEIAKLGIPFNAYENGWVVYPPLSALPMEPIVQENKGAMDITSPLLLIQFLLLSLLIITSFMTGKQFQDKKTKTYNEN